LVAVLESERLSAAPDLGVLLEGAFTIVGVHELDEQARHQLFAREAKSALPRGIESLEVSVEVEQAKQIDRVLEEVIFSVACHCAGSRI